MDVYAYNTAKCLVTLQKNEPMWEREKEEPKRSPRQETREHDLQDRGFPNSTSAK